MQPKLSLRQMAGIFGVLLVFAAGLFLLAVNSRLAAMLRFGSYDCITDISSARRDTNSAAVVIIYMDEASHQDLAQPFNQPWDRALHARLLSRLTDDRAKGVVFDIVFTDPGLTPHGDDALAKAIRDNGHVILAADFVDNQTSGDTQRSTHERSLILPYEPFRKAAAGWGFAQLQPDEDFLIREHRHGMPDHQAASLAWVASQTFGFRSHLQSPDAERWINYYGQPGQVAGISYKYALTMPKGYFHDTIVFIGARPMTGHIRERKDEFRSPYANWFTEPVFMPAVEIHAVTLLNLMHGDWLKRLSPASEWLILLLSALFFGYGITRFSQWTSTLVTVMGVIGIVLFSILLLRWGRFWFPWLIPVAVQAPLGLISAFIFRSIEWYEQKRRYEQSRRLAEDQIREQAALLDKAQDAILVHGLDGKTTYCNPSALLLYGWTAAEMREQNAAEILFGADLVQFSAAFSETLSKGDWVGELAQFTKTGRKVIVNSRWSRIADENGRPKAVLVINTNITERKKLESQLWHAQRTRSIGALASGIAHDLNNILTPVLMIAEILRRAEPSEKKQKMLQAVELSAERAAGMAKQILAFVRGGEGELLVLQPKHLVRDITKIIQDTFPKNIAMDVRIDPELAAIKGDATQIHQILLNLCVNARDAMPGGGTLLVVARNISAQEASQVPKLQAEPVASILLQVTDTGTGIAPEILNNIFDPFFTTKEPGKGTGLGLATVLGIVKHHRGCIEVGSQPGKGSVFSVYIPAVHSPVVESMAPAPLVTRRGQSQTILVADDEPLVRAIIELLLKEHNYRVIQAENGRRALELFALNSAKVDLIILDLMMPEIDGATVMQTMVQMNPKVKFITLSGVAQAGSDTEGNSEKIRVLQKPVSVEKLLVSLNQMLG